MFAKSKPTVTILATLFIIICALLPFHAFISTWLISNFGFELLFKAWKEILLFFVMVPLAAWVALTNKALLRKLITSRLNQLIVAFIALNGLVVVLLGGATNVVAAGLTFNTRFFVFFLVAQIVAYALVRTRFSERVLQVLFWAGVAVVVFGTLQVFVLPADFLRHFGYSLAIIPPYFTVDNNENIVRILSTLRGPNALGAYLIVWVPLLAYTTRRIILRFGWSWHAAGIAVVWFCTAITLYGSRSRSGWLGVVIALTVFVLLSVNRALQKRLLLIGAIFTVLVSTLLVANWNSSFVQTTLKHKDPAESSQVDSDVDRTSSLQLAINAIIDKPLGHGVGSANIASTYGDNPKTVENYYLQMAYELGVVGFLLFVAIIGVMGVMLWRLRHLPIGVVLFSSFVGLFVANLFLPTWGDETVSMLWWGLAGVFLAEQLVKHKKRATI